MTVNYAFTGCRIFDDTIIPCDWTLSFNLMGKESPEETPERIVERIHFWLEIALDNLLMVNVGDECALDVADLLSNQVLYTPGAPTDDLLVRLFHAKLSAISSQGFSVEALTLSASDSNTSYTFHPDPQQGYNLPKTVLEYTGSKGVEDDAWWHRNDGWTFDFLIPEDEGFDPKEWFAEITDPLIAFDEVYDAVENGTVDEVIPTETSEDGKIIKVDIWKTETENEDE